MRQNAILFFLSVVFCLCHTACTFEASGNGALDGYWHLEQIDTLSTGGTLDLSQTRRFWAVQHKLMQTFDRNKECESIFFRFEWNGKTLRLYNPYLADRAGGDKPLEYPELMYPFGINHDDESFRVEKLSGSTLQIVSSTLRLRFKRF